MAIKSIRKTKIDNETDLRRIRREIDIMSSLRHPHLISIYEGMYVCDFELYITTVHNYWYNNACSKELDMNLDCTSKNLKIVDVMECKVLPFTCIVTTWHGRVSLQFTWCISSFMGFPQVSHSKLLTCILIHPSSRLCHAAY